jgi:hypothetical protein
LNSTILCAKRKSIILKSIYVRNFTYSLNANPIWKYIPFSPPGALSKVETSSHICRAEWERGAPINRIFLRKGLGSDHLGALTAPYTERRRPKDSELLVSTATASKYMKEFSTNIFFWKDLLPFKIFFILADTTVILYSHQ